MRGHNRQNFRLFLVVALGAGLAGLAGPSARSERPAPIVLAAAMESAALDHCLRAPRDEDDSARTSGDAQAKGERNSAHGERAKKRVIACG